MADEKIRYVLDVDDKGTPKLVKFGTSAESSGKKAKKSFEGAGKAVTDFADQIPGASNAMSMFSKGPAAAAGMAIAAVGVGFAAAMKKSIDFADNINDLSLRLGVSTEQLSVLSLYAEQSGTDIETLATAMGKLGVKISEGDKNLKKYGVTAGTADEALFQLADKIAATEDPMLRLKIATDAFGKSGQQMLPLLVQGGAALREMAGAAPIVSAEMAAASDAINDRFAELQGRILGIGLGIAEKVIPQIDIWLDGVDRIRKAMGLLSADEEYQAKRAEARAKIINQYADLQEQRKAGEKLIGKASGPVQIGGMSLQQSLAAFDRNNPVERAKSQGPAKPPGTSHLSDEEIKAAEKELEFQADIRRQIEEMTATADDKELVAIKSKYAKQMEAHKENRDSLLLLKQAQDTELQSYYQKKNFDELAAQRDKDQAASEAQTADAKRSFQNPWESNEEAAVAKQLQDAGLIGENGVGVFDATQMNLEEMQQALADYKASLDGTVEATAVAAERIDSLIVGIASSTSSVLADGFMQIGGGVDDMLESMADGFAQMLTRMVAELAANAIILGFLSAVAPGAAGGFSKGLGGLSGLVLGGKASGGIPEVGTPTMVNERRQEVFIPRSSGRVEPTASGGDTYHITVSNPAEARSTIREIQRDKRRRNTGVR